MDKETFKDITNSTPNTKYIKTNNVDTACRVVRAFEAQIGHRFIYNDVDQSKCDFWKKRAKFIRFTLNYLYMIPRAEIYHKKVMKQLQRRVSAITLIQCKKVCPDIERLICEYL